MTVKFCLSWVADITDISPFYNNSLFFLAKVRMSSISSFSGTSGYYRARNSSYKRNNIKSVFLKESSTVFVEILCWIKTNWTVLGQQINWCWFLQLEIMHYQNKTVPQDTFYLNIFWLLPLATSGPEHRKQCMLISPKGLLYSDSVGTLDQHDTTKETLSQHLKFTIPLYSITYIFYIEFTILETLKFLYLH